MRPVAKAAGRGFVYVFGLIGAVIGWTIIFPIVVMIFNYCLRAIWQAGLVDFTWIGRAIGVVQ